MMRPAAYIQLACLKQTTCILSHKSDNVPGSVCLTACIDAFSPKLYVQLYALLCDKVLMHVVEVHMQHAVYKMCHCFSRKAA